MYTGANMPELIAGSVHCRQQQLVQAEDGCCKPLGHLYLQQGHKGLGGLWGRVWCLHCIQGPCWWCAVCNGDVYKVITGG